MAESTAVGWPATDAWQTQAATHRHDPKTTPPPSAHQEWFRGLQSRVMTMDWSWNRPALMYTDLYYAAAKK